MENGSSLALASIALIATAGAVVRRLHPLHGIAHGMGEDEFDPQALAMGTQVQLQHTRPGDRKTASIIARDHLAEHPDYYDALAVMQRRLSQARGVS